MKFLQLSTEARSEATITIIATTGVLVMNCKLAFEIFMCTLLYYPLYIWLSYFVFLVSFADGDFLDVEPIARPWSVANSFLLFSNS